MKKKGLLRGHRFPFIFSILIIGTVTIFFNAREIGDSSEGKFAKGGVETIDIDDATATFEDEEECEEREYNWASSDIYCDFVAYATSNDFKTWTDGSILSEHASVPDAVIKEDMIYLYFVDISDDTAPEQISVMVRHVNGDNNVWSSKQTVVFEGIGDIVPVDPAPILLESGIIRLYYYDIHERNCYPEETHKIYYADSEDGYTFTANNTSVFRADSIMDPKAIRFNGYWRMYVGQRDTKTILSATSNNSGETFTLEGTAFSNGTVPSVMFNKRDNNFYLYHVIPGTGGIIGMAKTSTSRAKDIESIFDKGSNFKATSYTFKTELGTGLTADPGIIKTDDNSYIMFFKGKEVGCGEGQDSFTSGR